MPTKNPLREDSKHGKQECEVTEAYSCFACFPKLWTMSRNKPRCATQDPKQFTVGMFNTKGKQIDL